MNVPLHALRNLRHQKLQSLVNILSVALGMAVFTFALLYVKQQLSYNMSWPDAGRIHRLVLEQRGLPGSAGGESTSVDARAWPAILDYFASDIEAATRVHARTARVKESSSQSSSIHSTFENPPKPWPLPDVRST